MSRRSDIPLIVLAWVLLAAALFAAYAAWISATLLCENGCDGSLATIRTWQTIVPLAGLLPTALMVYFAHRREWLWAMLALLAALCLYGLWGWLLELLTHPSDHGIEV